MSTLTNNYGDDRLTTMLNATKGVHRLEPADDVFKLLQLNKKSGDVMNKLNAKESDDLRAITVMVKDYEVLDLAKTFASVAKKL
ncbi:hypothetical protein ON010_g13478 [Phytophthora cinnamomi]|nr:hypothetical protein ON010_g13478 [Phytophthora cinnamomi]